jgi:hypothetical protein
VFSAFLCVKFFKLADVISTIQKGFNLLACSFAQQCYIHQAIILLWSPHQTFLFGNKPVVNALVVEFIFMQSIQKQAIYS